jgi:hypothetical protein
MLPRRLNRENGRERDSTSKQNKNPPCKDHYLSTSLDLLFLILDFYVQKYSPAH